jgi:signal transduction histidine kinase/DNA-binding response OmpR family regulator
VEREAANILLVDDDDASRAATAAVLAELGENVVEAKSGLEALRACLQADFAVVVLDLLKPELDGFEIAAMIRARPRSENTPFLFLTGSEPALVQVKGYAVGAVDFLRKPADPFVLRSKVRIFVSLWRQSRALLRAEVRLRELEATELHRRAEERAGAERARGEAKLRGVLDKQAVIFQSVPVVLHTRSLDTPSRVTWVSANVERVLGFPDARFALDPELWAARLHPEDRPLVTEALLGLARSGRASFEYRWRGADEAWRWLKEHVVTAQGEIVGTWLDIGEHKRLEEALQRVNEDLDRRVAQRTGELAATVEELDSFSYAVSHDLRTPLRSLAGFTQILLAQWPGEPGPTAREAVDRIDAAVKRMAQLIDDLLRLSQVARLEVQHAPADLSAMAAEIVDGLRAMEPDRDVRVDVQPGLVADVDQRLVRIALENLLANAWKFTRPRATAHLSFGAEPDTAPVVYRVRDDGVGFDMAYVRQLFRAFHRLHPADEFEGTGIGLATVRRVVQRHGGDIWAESAPGEGATFYFTLEPPRVPQG